MAEPSGSLAYLNNLISKSAISPNEVYADCGTCMWAPAECESEALMMDAKSHGVGVGRERVLVKDYRFLWEVEGPRTEELSATRYSKLYALLFCPGRACSMCPEQLQLLLPVSGSASPALCAVSLHP